MRKKIAGLLLTMTIIFSMVTTSFAASLSGGDGWYVNFTGSNPLTTNFSGTDMSQAASQIEPGDDITFNIKVQNTKSEGQAVNYYLKNEILKSFETATAEGAAYTYKLYYTDPTGKQTVFYDNTSVGGSNGNGLMDVESVLEGEYFFLGLLNYGEEGQVTVYVALDGETQGNAYQSTMAQLDLQFMVEEVESKPADNVIEETSVASGKTVTYKSVVNTGDRTNLLPLWIAFAVAGVVLVVLAIILIKRRKRNDEDGDQK